MVHSKLRVTIFTTYPSISKFLQNLPSNDVHETLNGVCLAKSAAITPSTWFELEIGIFDNAARHLK